ncbi:hypothetical protein [Methylosinus sporium]|uniref:hypothetical protein n=1 Tax=Methylosinus sporium TaxID=428 RepID=UPI00383BF481
MNDDEHRALRWLLGCGAETETLRLGDKDRIVAHLGEQGDREALIRVLRSEGEINRDVRNSLANALEAIGPSEMRLRLVLTRRSGRGRPSRDVELAVEQVQRAAMARKFEASGLKVEFAAEEAAKELKISRSTVFSAKKAAKGEHR